MSDDISYERYQRQVLLKEFGQQGQQKLLQSRVLVIGAGGLGCAALQYLAAAGVGTIGILDDDAVSLNNLHRQVLFSTDDIGSAKAQTAASKLKRLNPEIDIKFSNSRITNQNALGIISEYDVVIDGTDNFASRYLINDACVLLRKPLVYGAVSQFEGQVAVFNCSTTSRPVNYRDLFPQPPKENEVLNCAEAGVLGVLPGIIGTMQANETIKLITGIGETLTGRLLTYNALTNNTYVVNLLVNEEADAFIPKDENKFLNTDYEWLCASHVDNDDEIDTETFNELLKEHDTTVVDVREYGELPAINEFHHFHIPLSHLRSHQPLLNGDTIVVFCQTGKRSLEAVNILRSNSKDQKKIYSLRGGITEWKKTNK